MPEEDIVVMHDELKSVEDLIEEQKKVQDSTDAVQEDRKVAQDNYKDQFIRLSADFNNYKKRVEKERYELLMTAQGSVIEKIIPFIDDLDRAFEFSEKALQPEFRGWLEGFRLMEKNLVKTLTDFGVEEVAATGSFNPEFHEALMSVECPEGKNSGDIVQVLSKGYTFKGKVLKHAKVSVAK